MSSTSTLRQYLSQLVLSFPGNFYENVAEDSEYQAISSSIQLILKGQSSDLISHADLQKLAYLFIRS